MSREEESLRAELGREPTAADVAARLGHPVEFVIDVRQAVVASRVASLDEPSGNDTEPRLWSVRAPAERTELADDAVALEQAMTALSERDRVVVLLRFRLDLTQKEIGRAVGLSQMQVSRILRHSLELLRVRLSRE